MSEQEWKVRGEPKDYWIDLEVREDGESGPRYRAAVKWDGCIHFNRYFNGVDPDKDATEAAKNADYLHICDIDETIALLQALKAKALAHFGEDWP